MEGEESFKQFSPEVRLKDLNVRKAAALLPHIILFHGSADYSIPPEARLAHPYYIYEIKHSTVCCLV